MSTLKADTIQNTSGGAVTLTNQAAAKVFLYAQQRTATVESKNSLNVSSWNDDGSGKSTTNITNAMSGTDYILQGSSSYDATSGSGVNGSEEIWPITSSQFKHDTMYTSTFLDCDYLYAAVFGDLA